MSGDRLIIFARYPAPGRAKTRLIPALGTHGAALLQHRMTRHTLDAVRQFAARRGDAQVELRSSGDLLAMRQLYPGPWEVTDQGDGSLGYRLQRAVAEAFAHGAGRVVVLGTDCPALTAEHLAAAFAALDDHNLVLGPAADGGYYLIALGQPVLTLFDGIDWSTARVLEQTCAAAARAGLSVAQLDTLSDVDRPEDLPAMRPAVRRRGIAVTGATGIVGTRFLQRVLRDDPDLQVTALIRRASASFQRPAFQKLLARYRSRMTLIEADLRSLRLSMDERRAIGETDGGLWHFAANTNLRPGGGPFAEDVWAVNAGGTSGLLDLVLNAARAGPFFHVSTAYICGADAGMAYEDCTTQPSAFRNSYEASKHCAEERVRHGFVQGLRGAIFRPSLIVGDELTGGACNAVDLLGDALMKAVVRQAGPLVLRLPCDAAINVVHVDWVVESLIALGRPDVAGTTYHLTSRAPLRLADLARILRPDHPGSALVLDADAELKAMSPLSRAIDRALAPLRPYLDADVSFDRENFNRDAPALRAIPEFDARAVFDHRVDLASSTAEADTPEAEFEPDECCYASRITRN